MTGARRRCGRSTTTAGPASSPLERNARHRYTIEAWRDAYGSLREALRKKVEAEVPFGTEIAEARLLLESALQRARAGRTGRADARLLDGELARLASGALRRDARRDPALAGAARRGAPPPGSDAPPRGTIASCR